MRLALTVALVMIAFAANSVLNRLALDGGWAGPGAFAAVRLASGAAVLALLVRLSGRRMPWAPAGRRAAGAATLAVYVLGFSFAYLTLAAGTGALILFGGVQVTMFAGALIGGERPSPARWAGAALAAAGVAWLCWPAGGTAPDPLGAALMGAAAVGWGLYSLLGRRAGDPLGNTAANFAVAAPAGLVAWAVAQDGMAAEGLALAVLSGAVTSGLGYALWYRVLPALAASAAALAQLTVPVIAQAGGALVLGEALTGRFAVAAALVAAGVIVGSVRPR